VALVRRARGRRAVAPLLPGALTLRRLRQALLALGLVLLVVLVATNDPRAILASITQLSWRLAIVLCFPVTLVMALDTLGWRFAFLRDEVPFRTLLSARLAGEAFNLATPTAALGGEAVKAWLLRAAVPLDVSVSSVIVAKTTITIAQGVFLLLGIGLAWTSAPPGSPLLHGMLWLLAIETVALAGFVVAQTRGVLSWGGRLLGQLGVVGVETAALGRIDDALARFYRTSPGRLTLSLGFHLAAWVLGSVETWLILHFLGVPVSWTTATVIEAFGTAVRFATFVIPASLGALEGGYLITFAALGLPPTSAVSFSLVRRIREAAWVGLGLIAFALSRHHAGEARSA
jgi:putative membrane protein